MIGPPDQPDAPALPIHDDLLPVDPPIVPILLEAVESVESPPGGQPVDDLRPRSLLESLDLTLPVEPYLAPVEAEGESLLDELDLTLRRDETENAPIMLEEIASFDTSSNDAPALLPVNEDDQALVLVADAGSPIAGEATPIIEPPPLRERRPSAPFRDGGPYPRQRDDEGRRDRDEDDRYGRRDQRRRPIGAPRRRPVPPPSNWVSDNTGAILVIGMLVAVVVVSILVVKLLEDRGPARSTFASEQRRPKRFEPPEWQQNPPRFQVEPMFPQVDPPGIEVKKPFAEPPMIEPGKIVETRKPRAKSKLPQEKREWVDLSATAVRVDPAVDMPQIDSRPVELAAKGTTYNYLIDVRARTAGTKILLEFGPPGMKLQTDARLVWQVPDVFAEADTDIVIRVKQADGKECTQSFVISIR
jgi:hypothetical protein